MALHPRNSNASKQQDKDKKIHSTTKEDKGKAKEEPPPYEHAKLVEYIKTMKTEDREELLDEVILMEQPDF